jgi:multidrug resistance efflux pump
VNKRAIAILLLLGLGLLGLRWAASPTDPEPAETSVFSVKRGLLPITLVETGTLNTKNASNIRADVEGAPKISWLVDEGAVVKSGDVLVELDKTDCKKRIEDLQNQMIQARSDLKTAETDRDVQDAQNKTDWEKAKLALQVAWVQLEKLVYGEIPAEEKKRKLRIEKGRSGLQKADEKYKTMPGLRDLGFVTRAQVEEERLKVQEARVELDAAEQDMDLYEEYEKPLALKQKTADFTQAWREVWSTKQRVASQEDQRGVVVFQRKLTVKAIRERLDEEKKRLEGMTLKA